MKSLEELLASARRAPHGNKEENTAAAGSSRLADHVLAALREDESEVAAPSEWLVLGRWATGLACALALIAVLAAPQTEEPADPPASNPLAAMGGW